MGLTEIFLVLSVLANWWLYGENQEVETKLKQSIAIATECQEIQRESRQRELESEEQRDRDSETIRGLVARSELNVREFDQMDSVNCGSVLLPSGNKRVEEHARRTDTINNQWMSGPSGSDEP
jgi:hypothetical protein